MRINHRLAALTFLAASPFLASGAFAQSAQEKATDAAIACLEIADSSERLACLEGATREIAATRIRSETAEEAAAANALGAPVIAGENATAEELFGAEALQSTKTAKLEKDKHVKLSAKVIEFRIDPFKDITAVLDNGQMWKQLSGDNTIIFLPKSDKVFTVTIKKGSFGNYLMRINELKRTIRVRRIK